MTVRQAKLSDLEVIDHAYLETLRYLSRQGYPIKPTIENSTKITEMIFIPAIESQSGPFIAIVDGEPVGALFWAEDAHPVEVEYRTATSYGQWVHEDHRGLGLVSEMVKYALRHMKGLNIKRIVDMVHTKEGADAAIDCGFQISENFVTYEL